MVALPMVALFGLPGPRRDDTVENARSNFGLDLATGLAGASSPPTSMPGNTGASHVSTALDSSPSRWIKICGAPRGGRGDSDGERRAPRADGNMNECCAGGARGRLSGSCSQRNCGGSLSCGGSLTGGSRAVCGGGVLGALTLFAVEAGLYSSARSWRRPRLPESGSGWPTSSLARMLAAEGSLHRGAAPAVTAANLGVGTSSAPRSSKACA
mmetsp:Transcript_36738/g.105940  ORF Transcript_36738/g.105940 Transcript_36738/m.105940 type:complete len:212 (-) Transcript_36738:202-837(-)